MPDCTTKSGSAGVPHFRHTVIFLLFIHAVIAISLHVPYLHEWRFVAYSPLGWSVITGLVLGLYSRPSLIRDTVAISLAETCFGLGIVLLDNSLWKEIASGRMPEGLPFLFPIALTKIGLTLFGGLVGWNLRRHDVE